MHHAPTRDLDRADVHLPPGLQLSRVVYRSRALHPFSIGELRALTDAARLRNAQEQITGLVLYDNERFYQWLEGPDASVDRVMQSIRRDPRHGDIDVLDQSTAPVRSFAGWSMKLAAAQNSPFGWLPDTVRTPAGLVESLHATPGDAASLLVKLVSISVRVVNEPVSDLHVRRSSVPVLKQVFLSAVVPELVRAGVIRLGKEQIAADSRCEELADSLMSGDVDAPLVWLARLRDDGGKLGQLAASLFEPVARRLGDLWADDTCSEFDVTFALCRLQTLLRLLAAPCPNHLPVSLRPRILIATEPGELHRLGAALDRIVLESAGWSPVCAYPGDNAALDDILAQAWFDVLDLTLSTALRREQDLPRVAETIAEARRASRNPDMVVVVGGRIFAEQSGAAARVGADAAHVTARGLNRTILRTLASHARPGGVMGPPVWMRPESAAPLLVA